MEDKDKKLEGYIAGYQKYKAKYRLMVRFAEKRLLPKIECLKAKRQILIQNRSRYGIAEWTIMHENICDNLRYLENLYEELNTIEKT